MTLINDGYLRLCLRYLFDDPRKQSHVGFCYVRIPQHGPLHLLLFSQAFSCDALLQHPTMQVIGRLENQLKDLDPGVKFLWLSDVTLAVSMNVIQPRGQMALSRVRW